MVPKQVLYRGGNLSPIPLTRDQQAPVRSARGLQAGPGDP